MVHSAEKSAMVGSVIVCQPNSPHAWLPGESFVGVNIDPTSKCAGPMQLNSPATTPQQMKTISSLLLLIPTGVKTYQIA